MQTKQKRYKIDNKDPCRFHIVHCASVSKMCKRAQQDLGQIVRPLLDNMSRQHWPDRALRIKIFNEDIIFITNQHYQNFSCENIYVENIANSLINTHCIYMCNKTGLLTCKMGEYTTYIAYVQNVQTKWIAYVQNVQKT